MRRGRLPTKDILTPREWEVLELLRAGLTNEQIAERLGISYDGAKFHVSEIITKLGVRSRYEAAAWRPNQGRRWQWAGFAIGLREAAMKTLGALPLVGAAGAIGLLVIGLLFMQARQQSSASTAVAPSDSAGLSTSTPASWLKKISRIGTTTTPESCCAVRGSLTRDEIATEAAIAISDSSGAHSSSRISQAGVTIAAKTRADSATPAMAAAKTAPHAQVSAMAGMSAANALPSSSSTVRTGAASSGSSVRLAFSPTIL